MWCIDNRCTDIHFNLAAEEYLLKHRSENFFMVWQSAPAVVIGRHQSMESEVNEVLAGEKGIALARRFSGGGAVYQDLGNVNLTFIETAAQLDFGFYLQLVVDFLGEMGIEATVDSRMGIYVEGRKVSGSAQCVHKNRVLYHCTLLFDTDLTMLDAVLRGGTGEPMPLLKPTSAARAVPSVRSEVTNLAPYFHPPIGVKRFMRLLLRHVLEMEETNRMYKLSEKDIHTITKSLPICNDSK